MIDGDKGLCDEGQLRVFLEGETVCLYVDGDPESMLEVDAGAWIVYLDKVIAARMTSLGYDR